MNDHSPASTIDTANEGVTHSAREYWAMFFPWLWKAVILLLPWQTRVIFFRPTIASSSWEQGTFAVYASWILIILTVVAGCLTVKEWKGKLGQIRTWIVVGIFIALLLISSAFTASPIATILWGLHALLLTTFGWILWNARISRQELSAWFVIALMPHVFLGLWQFWDQKVDASTLLGMAAQRAWIRGASVVEFGEYRMLRIYGGFPHPNVFGGWLAIAMTLIPSLIASARKSRDAFLWIGCLLLCSMALVFTFSRGAWLAAFIGCFFAFGLAWKHAVGHAREVVRLAFLMFLLALTFSVCSQLEPITSRFVATERLERWSLEQRVTSFQDGFRAFLLRPVVGWGPGSAVVAMYGVTPEIPESVVTLSAEGKWVTWHPSIEPPHAAPLAALVELGVIGILLLGALGYLLIRHLLRLGLFMQALPLLGAIGALALTDHYLWTLWAGKCLLGFVIISVLLDDSEKIKEPSFHNGSGSGVN